MTDIPQDSLSGPSQPLASDVPLQLRRSESRLSYRTSLALSIALLVVLTGATLTAFAVHSSRANTAVLTDALFREVTAHAVTQEESAATTPAIAPDVDIVVRPKPRTRTHKPGMVRVRAVVTVA